MNYNTKVQIAVLDLYDDGYGGKTSKQRVVKDVMCKVAPYTISELEVNKIAKPYTAIKFFTRDDIGVEDESEFFIIYNGKTYKKISIIDYGKCIMIVGERV